LVVSGSFNVANVLLVMVSRRLGKVMVNGENELSFNVKWVEEDKYTETGLEDSSTIGPTTVVSICSRLSKVKA
jgi:hypothetical protein